MTSGHAANDDTGWQASAEAWIAEMGDDGDWSRRVVLDAPMGERVQGRGFHSALDVGCGEGRFCRRLRDWGVRPVGIDPTPALLAQARRLDPGGDYCEGRAEALPFPNATFDLVVSYLTLIDIADVVTAIPEMARVLKPGGSLLVANLNSFAIAGGWVRDAEGRRDHFVLDHYLAIKAERARWRGIDVVNWRRPLSFYMQLFLGEGLVLTHFDEPAPREESDRAREYRRAPWHMIMEWRKPG